MCRRSKLQDARGVASHEDPLDRRASACLLVTACVSSGPESQLGKEDKSPKRIEMSRTSDCVFQSHDRGLRRDRRPLRRAVRIGPAQGLPRRDLRRLLRHHEPGSRSLPSTATATGRSAASAATRSPTRTARHGRELPDPGPGAALGRAPPRARPRRAAAEAAEGAEGRAAEDAPAKTTAPVTKP